MKGLFGALPGAIAGSLLLAGCASPGPPRAPSLHLVQPAKALTADRVGDQVLLSWTTPAATTDGGRLLEPLTAVVCREVPGHGCTTVLRQGTVPGAAHAADTLPVALLTGPAHALAYHVELLNAHQLSAGLSAAAYAASGPAPAPVQALAVVATRDGAQVTWKPATVQPGTVMDLTRTPSADSAARAHAKEPARKSSAPAAVHLHPGIPNDAGGGTGASADPGGVIDRTFAAPSVEGEAFIFVAQRVQTVTADGHTLTLLGLASTPVAFTFHNTFAPDAPAGLVAIPSVSPAAIDLSWEASPDPYLRGYVVFRRAAAGPFEQISPQPLTAPAFRDMTAMPGILYTYRVVAIDHAGNRSAPSVEVPETIR